MPINNHKNNLSACILKVIVFSFSSLLFLPASGIAQTLHYNVKPYSRTAHKLMKESNARYLYEVEIKNPSEYFGQEINVSLTFVKLMLKRRVPGKSFVKFSRSKFLKDTSPRRKTKSRKFFSHLEEGGPYTYAILPDRMVFTKSTSEHRYLRDKTKHFFSKHYFISGLQRKVYYAGEFHIIKHHNKKDIEIVFSNSSGTYRPDGELLSRLEDFLEYNFGDDGIYFSTQPYWDKTAIAKKMR